MGEASKFGGCPSCGNADCVARGCQVAPIQTTFIYQEVFALLEDAKKDWTRQAVREAVPEIDQRCRPSILSKLPPIQLTGQALKAALEMIAPDGTDEQLAQSVCIQWRDECIDVDGHPAPAGWCAWDYEYPEEGSILIAAAQEAKPS